MQFGNERGEEEGKTGEWIAAAHQHLIAGRPGEGKEGKGGRWKLIAESIREGRGNDRAGIVCTSAVVREGEKEGGKCVPEIK